MAETQECVVSLPKESVHDRRQLAGLGEFKRGEPRTVALTTAQIESLQNKGFLVDALEVIVVEPDEVMGDEPETED